MPYATVAEAEARIAELEKETRTLTRESVSRKDGLKELEEKHTKLVDALKKVGIGDLDGNIEEQIASASGKTEVEKTLKSMEKRLKTAEETAAALMADKTKLEKEGTQSKLRSLLSEGMKDIIGASDTIEALILREKVKHNKDGKPVYIDDDGDELAIDKYVEKFKKNNPDRIKVSPNPGSGGSGGGGSGGKGPGSATKTITQAEYLNLLAPAKKTFYAEGGHVEG
jgi:hypothetical protein